MKDKLKKSLAFLAENITNILAIVFGIILFFTYKNYLIEELLNYIISLLTLISGSLLIEKLIRLTSIDKNVRKIKNALIKSNLFIYCHTSTFWKDALTYGNSIFISGGSLFLVFSKNSGDFEELLKNKCKIEVVLMKPFSDASNLLYQNVVKEINSTDEFNQNILQTLGFLKSYMLKYPNQITIRLNDQVPAFGLMAVYKKTLPQKIQVNFYSEKVSYDKRLSLSVENIEDCKIAYQYYCKQIDYLKERLPVIQIEDIEQIIRDRKQ